MPSRSLSDHAPITDVLAQHSVVQRFLHYSERADSNLNTQKILAKKEFFRDLKEALPSLTLTDLDGKTMFKEVAEIMAREFGPDLFMKMRCKTMRTG